MKPYHIETWVGELGVVWLGSRWQLQRRNRIPVTGRLFRTVEGNRAVRGSRAQLLNHALWLQGRGEAGAGDNVYTADLLRRMNTNPDAPSSRATLEQLAYHAERHLWE